ncbi:glycosyltransferase family 2 protein [Microbacterium sp. SSW1-59]|uniref:glycosyltransferase family 2 protein n=1 Tax=Microbacterium xanthum TaxID=3079794 RepID=UPI002AD31E23|nr:glycosyltransferase family 2 protein [Microbacterium sp. SSW1-59]MDZ8201119.1 glycosyltransferase family 2 protein [Microbacterium sp. SSW1-59]
MSKKMSATGRRPVGRVVALLPAHDESDTIRRAVAGLRAQTVPPDRIIVIPDNCTDDTAAIAASTGAEVRPTSGNSDKKAGALNQALAALLPDLEDDDAILVQDADSALDEPFIERALSRLADPSYGAVGGVFRGDDRPGFVAHLQRNEYARYARDVSRLQGRCLVVTGTAALFRVRTLREISEARRSGGLPAGDGDGGVYDTTVLTEDNEISFAVLHLGYRIISPSACTLITETMPTWHDLWAQRLRWKRGAVENCMQYGLTRVTWSYWGRQILTMCGVVVTAVYIATLVAAIVSGTFAVHPFWLGVTAVFVVERVVTVRLRGWRQMLLAATMYELVLDGFLQIVQGKAYVDAFTGRRRRW